MGIRDRIRSLLLTLWVISLAGSAQANPFIFDTLPPDGIVSGPAGTTIGWGYTLTNPSETDWLVPTAVSADLFELATPNAAVFDFVLTALAPGATRIVPYEAGISGLYELTWDENAPVGFGNSGIFIISAEWWSGDPEVDGVLLPQLAIDQSAAYLASVAPPPTPPVNTVPEPSGMTLLAVGLAACCYRVRSRRKRIDG